MKRVVVAVCLVALATTIGVAAPRVAAGSGTFTVKPTSVVAGANVTVSFCGFAAKEAGYYTIQGPSVWSTRFWGPASGAGCLDYIEPTAGWFPGKYKFVAYVSTSTGRASKIDAAVVTVAAP